MPREAPQVVAADPARHPRDVLTLKQVSEITGLSDKTFYNLRVKGGAPPFFVVRGRLRCYRSDLEAWLTEKEQS